MGLMSEAQRAGRWSQEVTRDGDSDDSAMQWALSSLSHGGVYRHLKPRYHRRTQTRTIPWYSMVFPFPHLGSPQDPPLVLNDAVQAYQIGNGSSAWVRDQHDLLSFPSPCPWVTFRR